MSGSGTLVEIPLTGGVDQHTEPRKLAAASLLSSMNACQPKLGRYGKRFGTTSLPTAVPSGTAAIAPPFVLGQRATEPLVVEAGRLLGYSPAQGQWQYRDQVSGFTARESSVAQFNGVILNPSMAINAAGTLRCYVWTGDYGVAATTIYALLIDNASGAVIGGGPSVILAAAGVDHACVVWVGTSFIVTCADQGKKIYASRLNTAVATPWAWTAPTTLVTNMMATFMAYDAIANGANFTIAYINDSGGANSLDVRTFTEALGAGATSTNIARGGANLCTSVSLMLVGTRLWIGYYESVAFKAWYVIRDATALTSILAATLISTDANGAPILAIADISSFSNNSAVVVWQCAAGGGAPDLIKYAMVNVAGFVAFVTTEYGKAIASRPVTYAGRCYFLATTVAMASGSALDPWQVTTELLEIGQMVDITATTLACRPVCTWAPRSSYAGFDKGPTAPLLVDASGNLRTVAAQTTQVSLYSGALPKVTLWDLTLETDVSERQPVELGGLTYIPGGVPSWYDGLRVGECSFLQWPQAQAGSAAETVGVALSPSATYQYAIVYAQYDAAGNVHRSSPYIFSIALGANSGGHSGWSVPVTIQYYQSTTRQDYYQSTCKVQVEVYRTTANGSVFFLITPDDDRASGVAASSAGTMRNSPTSSTFVYTDTATDASLTGHRLLYTTGGILENVCPPSSRFACVHRGRVFFGGTPDGKTVWGSKRQIFGEAPGFSEGLTVYIDEGGAVTALASLDDKLIVFKQDRIFIVTGDGPDDAGQNSDWSDPIKLNSTVGAIDNHVVTTPLGVVFRSAVGLSLLTRDLQVQAYWGQAVEDIVAANTVTAGMVLHPTLPEIRILVSSNKLGTGRYAQTTELRFDYRHGAWFPASYTAYDPDFTGVGSVAVLNGIVYYAHENGSIFHENQATYLDDSAGTPSFVQTSLEFAPLQVAGTQGWQSYRSALFAGDFMSEHDLTIAFAYDDGGYNDTRSLGAATSEGWLTAGLAYQWEASTKGNAKYERVRLKLTDSYNAGAPVLGLGNGQGFSVSSIAFDAVPLGGPMKHLSTSQRF